MCTGCGLCASELGKDAATISQDEDGKLIPTFTIDKSISADFLERNCPGLIQSFDQEKPSHYSKHKIWGSYSLLGAGYANDAELRRNASSGGVITGIAKHLLENLKVNYVVGSRASLKDPLEVETVVITSPQDLHTLGGSRYAPSSPLKRIKEILETQPGIGCFIGRPCDVAALRLYLKSRPELQKKIYIMLSFFCAGAPTEQGTINILDSFSLKKEELASFRYRGDGWPGKVKAATLAGKTYEMSYEDSWRKILSPTVIWRCRLCPDGIGESADIVCADAWNVESGKVSFEESDGLSYIMARTATGHQTLKNAISAHAISYKEDRPSSELKITQFHQWYRKATLAYRYAGAFLMGYPRPKYSKRKLLLSATQASPISGARTLVGTIVRIAKKNKNAPK